MGLGYQQCLPAADALLRGLWDPLESSNPDIDRLPPANALGNGRNLQRPFCQTASHCLGTWVPRADTLASAEVHESPLPTTLGLTLQEAPHSATSSITLPLSQETHSPASNKQLLEVEGPSAKESDTRLAHPGGHGLSGGTLVHPVAADGPPSSTLPTGA